MKSRLGLTILFTLLCAPLFAGPRAGDQGFGGFIGGPLGLTGKMFLSNELAFDGLIGVQGGDLAIHADLLIHKYDLLKQWGLMQSDAPYELPLYVGVGPRIIFDDDAEFGIRFPVGASFFPANTKWEFYGEFAPVLRLTPSTGFNGDFGVGIRYYFDAIRPQTGTK